MEIPRLCLCSRRLLLTCFPPIPEIMVQWKMIRWKTIEKLEKQWFWRYCTSSEPWFLESSRPSAHLLIASLPRRWSPIEVESPTTQLVASAKGVQSVSDSWRWSWCRNRLDTWEHLEIGVIFDAGQWESLAKGPKVCYCYWFPINIIKSFADLSYVFNWHSMTYALPKVHHLQNIAIWHLGGLSAHLPTPFRINLYFSKGSKINS